MDEFKFGDEIMSSFFLVFFFSFFFGDFMIVLLMSSSLENDGDVVDTIVLRG